MTTKNLDRRMRELEQKNGTDPVAWLRVGGAAHSLSALGFGFDREIVSEAEISAKASEYMEAQRGTAFGQHLRLGA